MAKGTLNRVATVLGIATALAFGSGIVDSVLGSSDDVRYRPSASMRCGEHGGERYRDDRWCRGDRGDRWFREDRAEKPSGARPEAPRSLLAMEQIVQRVRDLGYTDITEIERRGGAYKVKARDPRGARVKLYLDAETGEVLRR